MRNLGFTLLDIMIVIAIIGILATIAIPTAAFYSARAKSVEARINLDLIGKGAIAFYSEEHSYSKGMAARTHEYPTINNSRDTKLKNVKGMSGVQPIGGMPYQSYNQKSATDGSTADKNRWNDGETQFGNKHNPADFEYQFSHYPWLDLNFRINSPFYYSYNYEGMVLENSVGKDKKAGVGKISYFAATASACLLHPCRVSGKYAAQGIKSDCDSGFLIVGGPHGTVSTIIDNSDFTFATSCGKALTAEIGNRIKFSDY